MKVKQTTFFCPFSRSSSPLLFHCGRLQDPSRPEEQSQSVSQSNLRSPEGERETQLQHSAPQKGRALAEAPAARGREGRRRGMPPRQASPASAPGTPASAPGSQPPHASRGVGRRPGPNFARLHRGFCLPVPHAICPRAQGPAAAQRWLCRLGAADSRTDN